MGHMYSRSGQVGSVGGGLMLWLVEGRVLAGWVGGEGALRGML